MKKILLTILACSAFTFYASAQIETSIGFKGGVHFNNFTGGDIGKTNWGSGPKVGGFVNLGLADIAQFQIEMLYSQENGNFSHDTNNYKASLGYLEIPLVLKLRIPLSENFFPYASIGQSVGYLISNKTSRTYVDGSNGEVEDPVTNIFTNFNLATLIGGGVDFESENVFFTLDLRYNIGNINISQQSFDIKSNGWALTAGLGFKIIKR